MQLRVNDNRVTKVLKNVDLGCQTIANTCQLDVFRTNAQRQLAIRSTVYRCGGQQHAPGCAKVQVHGFFGSLRRELARQEVHLRGPRKPATKRLAGAS